MYEIVCPLERAGCDQENKMEVEVMITGAKLIGGLPGAVEKHTVIL